MATNILMPALSPTMEEGKLAKWLVKEGDTVKSGTILAEIETDKATMEFEAVDEGKIGKILVPEGSEGVKVNAPIAVLLDEGEKRRCRRLPPRSRHSRRHEGHRRGGEGGSAPAAKAEAPRRRLPLPPARAKPMATRIFASPLARRIAAEQGHRSFGAVRHRPARPHRQIRRRECQARRGQACCRRARCRWRRRHSRRGAAARCAAALSGGLLRRNPARLHAQGHRQAPDHAPRR